MHVPTLKSMGVKPKASDMSNLYIIAEIKTDKE